MTLPRANQFVDFYKAVYGKQDDKKFGPFPWQERLAARVCAGEWPRVIALPTAAGKTACIDIAVFALACRAPNAPRRIFFVVDRRIVVDQAQLHAEHLATVLSDADSGILKIVADSLREIAQGKRPLDVYALRGGMYRETAWVRSPLQPTVIATTVDQAGSRLLFRGYGVSDSMKPIHAGLVGNDSIILLDEAHCSKPFAQTLGSIAGYRKWNDSPAPFYFVSISATSHANVSEAQVERDQAEDRSHPILGPRLRTEKRAELVVAEKAKGKKLAKELAETMERCARSLAVPGGCVGIIVNRLAVARELKSRFGEEAVLLTGRMRPLDRDRLFEDKLRSLLSGSDGTPPPFVIGTQCLEVGADFDFHALITECASLDALRQRFGRLNRVARRESANAVVVIRADQIEPKEKESDRDPIYGNSLPLTWKWLNENKDGVIEAGSPWLDFSVASIRRKLEETVPELHSELAALSANAPVILPAHLDCLVQTSPIPAPDVDPAIFLHGPDSGPADVQVVLRGDLGTIDSQWAEIVALCPPSSSEAVSVPVDLFRRWLTGKSGVDVSGDVEGQPAASDDELPEAESRTALRWQGPEDNGPVRNPGEVRAGSVYVLPNDAPDLSDLGDFPYCDSSGVPTDLGDEAFLRSRDKAILRLTGSKLSEDEDDFEDKLSDEIRAVIDRHADLEIARDHLEDPSARTVESYPIDSIGGWVVTSRRRLRQFSPEFFEDDQSSYSPARHTVTLEDHSRGVAIHSRRFAEALGLDANCFDLAGVCHDLGKLDPRFQRMLKGFSGGPPLAKSRSAAGRDRVIHNYPRGARHELLSAAMLATKTSDDLLLHLSGTHHSRGRPFANSVEENDSAATPFSACLFGMKFTLPSSAQQTALWNSELVERFWRNVRRFGWWGLAYIEAVFRLADQAESRAEQESGWAPPQRESEAAISFPAIVSAPESYAIPLPGLDGANPLAFLAALGLLVACDRISREANRPPDWLRGKTALSWNGELANSPVLHLSAAPPANEEFADYLADRLPKSLEAHPASRAVRMLTTDVDLQKQFQEMRCECFRANRDEFDWVTALVCETAPDGASQLQTVRRDYLIGNLKSVMARTKAAHFFRALFQLWDFADGLDNQSLHWEPTEDRRHAYQWHMPSGDPTRKARGGMLGANRLAIEAWPLFPSFPNGERVVTRGFHGMNSRDTFWTWPLWQPRLTVDSVTSIVGLPELQEKTLELGKLAGYGILSVFRSQRILVQKTPNLTAAVAIG
jgi:CRISPR-associated endonuclease/helicase Cas3